VAVEHVDLLAVDLPGVAVPVAVHGDAAPRPSGRSASVKARVAMVSPEAMPGRYAALAASSPECIRCWPASTTVEKYGAHSRRRPISSSTTMSST
jgi:hypothetical protein